MHVFLYLFLLLLMATASEMEVLMSTTATLVKIELKAAATTASTKHILENIIHVHVEILSAATLAMGIPLLLFPYTIRTHLIINSSLFWISQYLISISHFLKVLFRTFWIIWVLVWMVLDRFLFKCFFQFCFRCRFLHAKELVVVVLRWGIRFLLLLALSLLLLLLLALTLLLLLPLLLIKLLLTLGRG